MEKTRVTMKDIAKRLNFSQNTVSLALRNIPTIKKETRDLIIRTAEEMGYVYTNSNGVSQQPAGEIVPLSSNICIFTDATFFSPFYFYSGLKTTLESQIRAKGFGVIFETMMNPEMSLEQLKVFCEINNVAGIVIMGDVEADYVRLMQKLQLPVVLNGFYLQELFVDTVLEDNVLAIISAAKTLSQRGYRQIGFLGNVSMGLASVERYLGYRLAMEELGLVIRPEWVVLDSPSDMEAIYHEMQQYFKSLQSMPEVFMCSCDQIALCAMEVVQDMGLQVPKDIGFVGFDNVDLAAVSEPRLTTLDPNNAKQAALVVDIIVSKISHDQLPPRRQIVQVDWVEGGSIRPPE